MPTQAPNGPAAEFVFSAIKVTVWANESEDGQVRYSTYVSRSYCLPPEQRQDEKDNGWRKTHSLRSEDLLEVSNALIQAHAKIAELRAADRQARKEAKKKEVGR
ncbi:hypothetical protein [Botrimarina mediterranea]|uniref:Uncharacterized protein n=1 Tax=Botrimarina mediterranea TaxID=2528022 RepID=A0A518K796_9BACT|nr:hypothetical protein [Botrimarina mediterranea]QDV73665.1 hypothetical protein Spa11_18640 [Botrimarina mediterranea]QDV78255.1 hypothetical protein K2D_18620 [Planctomycetes bacterium K2D]